MNKNLKPALIQMVKVGLYWRQIKGRFSKAHSRTYLAMKYGYKWLARTKMLQYRRSKAAGKGSN